MSPNLILALGCLYVQVNVSQGKLHTVGGPLPFYCPSVLPVSCKKHIRRQSGIVLGRNGG